jgi:hypothetical protein
MGIGLGGRRGTYHEAYWPFLARLCGAADCDFWRRAAPVCMRLAVGRGADQRSQQVLLLITAAGVLLLVYALT